MSRYIPGNAMAGVGNAERLALMKEQFAEEQAKRPTVGDRLTQVGMGIADYLGNKAAYQLKLAEEQKKRDFEQHKLDQQEQAAAKLHGFTDYDPAQIKEGEEQPQTVNIAGRPMIPPEKKAVKEGDHIYAGEHGLYAVARDDNGALAAKLVPGSGPAARQPRPESPAAENSKDTEFHRADTAVDRAYKSSPAFLATLNPTTFLPKPGAVQPDIRPFVDQVIAGETDPDVIKRLHAKYYATPAPAAAPPNVNHPITNPGETMPTQPGQTDGQTSQGGRWRWSNKFNTWMERHLPGAKQ